MTLFCRYATILTIPALLLGACGDSAPSTERLPTEATLVDENLDENPTVGNCIAAGKLHTDLSGAIRTRIDWTASDGDLSCEGMRRPGDEGTRLRFSGAVENSTSKGGEERQMLTFILGLEGLKTGQIGAEIPTNVTLVEEGNGRFYATADTRSCWTDITYHEHVGPQPDNRIDGTVYCIAPLAELSGSAGVTFTELKFVGRLNWEVAE